MSWYMCPVLSLRALAVALAADRIPLRLPPSEDPADWAVAASLAGFDLEEARVGYTGPVVTLARTEQGWEVTARDGHGEEKRVRIPAPRTQADREDAVWVAGSLLRGLPDAARSTAPATAAPTGPEETPPRPASPSPRATSPAPRAQAPPPPPPPRPSSAPTAPPVPLPAPSAAPAGRPAAPSPPLPPSSPPNPPPSSSAPSPSSPSPPLPPPSSPSPPSSSAPPASPASPSPRPSPSDPPTSEPPERARPGGEPPSSALVERPRTLVPWVRLGAGGGWRPETSIGAEVSLDAGVRLRDVWAALGGGWSSPRALEDVGGTARMDAAAIRATVAWSPWSPRLAPWVGVGGALAWRTFRTDAGIVEAFFVPVAALEAGAAWTVWEDGAALALVPAARLALDVSETGLIRGSAPRSELSPWEPSLTLSVRGDFE